MVRLQVYQSKLFSLNTAIQESKGLFSRYSDIVLWLLGSEFIDYGFSEQRRMSYHPIRFHCIAFLDRRVLNSPCELKSNQSLQPIFCCLYFTVLIVLIWELIGLCVQVLRWVRGKDQPAAVKRERCSNPIELDAVIGASPAKEAVRRAIACFQSKSLGCSQENSLLR